MSTARTLPIRLAPLPGEAIDSWLEAIAARTHSGWADVTNALLQDAVGGPVRRAASWPLELPDGDAATIAAATGLGVAAVEAMTLGRYDGIAVGLRATRGLPAGFPWGRGRRSRYCPDCLADTNGRWQLTWRLGCVYACLEHQRLLADTCPQCRRPPQRVRGHGYGVPRPGRCGNPLGGGDGRCHADLTEATTLRLDGDHPALAGQRLVLDTIDRGQAGFGVYRDHPAPTAQALIDLYTVAIRALTDGSDTEIASRVPADLCRVHSRAAAEWHKRVGTRSPARGTKPQPAESTAVGVSIAMSVFNAPDITTAGRQLEWVLDTMRRRGWVVDPTGTAKWGRGRSTTFTAVQLKAMAPALVYNVDHLRYRTTTAFPTHPADDVDLDVLASRIPATLWPTWALRLTLPPCSLKQVESALSAALLLVGNTLDLREAVELVGGVGRANGISRTLARLKETHQWRNCLVALTGLAEYLRQSPPPIDYRRRRELDYSALLPETQWSQFCRRTGRSPAFAQSGNLARTMLFERLSGLPATRSPFLQPGFDLRAKYNEFPRELTPELTAELNRAGRELLDAHGLHAEPIDWQPPAHLLAGLALPGPNPAHVDVPSVQRLTRHTSMTLNQIAIELDTAVDVIRYLLQQHPAPPVGKAAGHRTPGAQSKLPEIAARLSPDKLIDLHFARGRTVAQIAATISTSEQQITRLAREYGIQLRPTCGGIDPEWLREQYIEQGRSLREIGDMTGFSRSAMSRYAERCGIPTRQRKGGRACTSTADADRTETAR